MKGTSATFCLIIGFVAVATFASAERAEVTVDIDKDQIVFGDSVRLSVTVKGIVPDTPPILPEFDDFDTRYIGTRMSSYSSVTVVIQGKTVEQKRTEAGSVFEYALTPKRVGRLDLPRFSFELAGETYHTYEPYTIFVTDIPEAQEHLLLKVSVDKENVYLGESVLFTFEWYFDRNIEDYSLTIPWYGRLKDFLMEDSPPNPNARQVQLILNDKERVSAEKETVNFRGKRYTVLRFKKILTPIGAGTYTLDPAFVRAEVVTAYEEPDRTRFFFKDYFDFAFEDVFGRGRRAITEWMMARSEPLSVSVKPIPETGRPGSFTGAVGEFDFQVSVSPGIVQQGEPVTVTMKVIGTGNFNEIQLPDFPEPPHFKGYAPEIRTDTSLSGNLVIGEKIFEKILVGRQEGAFEIPPIAFSFFDPQEGEYKTITRGPFPIRVEPGKGSAPPVLSVLPPEERKGKEIKVMTRDIRYIKSSLEPIVQEKAPFYERPFFWWFGFVPAPLLVGVTFLIQRRRLKLRTDIGYARRLKAFKKAEKERMATETHLRKGNAPDFYAGLSKTLTYFLADKLNRPPAGITADIVEDLKSRSLEPTVLQELKSCFERLDLAKYSRAESGTEEMQDLYEKVKQLIQRLDRVL